ncbi:MAG: GTPase [Phycisphaerae bacterium]
MLQTPPGLAGIAVITLAGPECRAVLQRVFQPLRPIDHWPDNQIRLGHILGPDGPIDQALACPRSDCVELNLHGGPAVARAVMQQLTRCGAVAEAPDGVDPALSWAHRRFDNPAIGREILGLLAEARCPLYVRILSAQWSGGISLLAEQVLATPTPSAKQAQQLRKAAAGLAQARRLQLPAEIALLGPPNAGKSTLANALTGRAVSIVHPTPGTTRDYVRDEARIGGVGVWVTDTAGLWDATDHLDAQAIQRVGPLVQRADVACLLSAGQPPRVPQWVAPDRCLLVATQIDRVEPFDGCDVAISAETGEGMEDLSRAILAKLGLDQIDPARARAVTARQAQLLGAAAGAIHEGHFAAARRDLNELLGRQ